MQTPRPGHSCGRPNRRVCPTNSPRQGHTRRRSRPTTSPQSAAVTGRMRWIPSKCAGPWICSGGNHELCDFAMEGLGWRDRERKKQVVAFANCHCTSATPPLQFYLCIPAYLLMTVSCVDRHNYMHVKSDFFGGPDTLTALANCQLPKAQRFRNQAHRKFINS